MGMSLLKGKKEDFSYINEEYLFQLMKEVPPMSVHDVPYRTCSRGLVLDICSENSFRNELNPNAPIRISVRNSRHICQWVVGLSDPYHKKILGIINREDMKSKLEFY